MPKVSNSKQLKKSRSISAATSNNKELHQMKILLDVSKQMAKFDRLDDMLKAIVEITSRETGAERGSLFLNDSRTGELFTKIAQGDFKREIRILNNTGVAGHVFTSGNSMIVNEAYKNEFFDRTTDEQTGFISKSILCAPVKTVNGKVIGVVQALNKKKGKFTKKDLALLETMATQAALSLEATMHIENMKKGREQEMEFLDIVSDITSEIEIGLLLQKVMNEATRMLKAERSTLFLNDEKTNELWSELGVGLKSAQIRFPNHLGIAGAVFKSSKTINIPYAYADLRFNPAFDKQTGFFTRSILCVPVVNKEHKIIGVTQVLNKHGGPFTHEDESRLKAFTAQVSIALENAKLFNDIQNMKNYNESMLESMTNGVITLNEDGKIVTCNAAGLTIFDVPVEKITGLQADDFFTGHTSWIMEKVKRVNETQNSDISMDAELKFEDKTLSVNLTVLPLISIENSKLGTMIMIDDISTEKRMKSTMSRYMDPVIADQLLGTGEDILGGKNTPATLLFSDIRSFTTLTEELGPQGTVSFLNEYFTIMVECIQREGGMLDKFIGDAIMAAFGVPIAHDDDEDRSVRAAISMISSMRKWNEQRAAQGKSPVDMGIGLNTGTVVTGNIGSPKRMDYTMIGDGVNLAARLESACKQYSARILISEFTFKKLRGTYRIREIDYVVVKGKTQPVGIYEVLDYHTEKTFPNLMEVVNHFKDGINLYRSQNWDKAIGTFQKVLKIHAKDKLSRTYIERCKLMKKKPPGDDWDGIWIMKTK